MLKAILVSDAEFFSQVIQPPLLGYLGNKCTQDLQVPAVQRSLKGFSDKFIGVSGPSAVCIRQGAVWLRSIGAAYTHDINPGSHLFTFTRLVSDVDNANHKEEICSSMSTTDMRLVTVSSAWKYPHRGPEAGHGNPSLICAKDGGWHADYVG